LGQSKLRHLLGLSYKLSFETLNPFLQFLDTALERLFLSCKCISLANHLVVFSCRNTCDPEDQRGGDDEGHREMTPQR
jgi:hypothetical protein